jgi:hypothetical protein
MGDVTFGADSRGGLERTVQRFGTVVVVGGGCYGSYYLRQLGRARQAKALQWTELIVVDRDARCAATLAPEGELPPFRLESSAWEEFFPRFLGAAALDPARHAHDAIVPSPLMPHLMAEWLLIRARERWPGREVRVAPLDATPVVPWQRAGADGTHYVSFADWMCPINCIEPPRCPHTRGERSWSLPSHLAAWVDTERVAGRPLDGPYIFHCSHRAYGVGMLDVSAVLAADGAIAMRGDAGAAAFLVGTASHCHGALQRIVVGA